MIELQGQNKLCERFNNLEDLPHSFILIGDVGCGKHTLTSQLVKEFDLTYLDISDIISSDTLLEFEFSKVPTLYVIDMDKLSNQNVVLKFIEDYDPFKYICAITNSKNLVLPTILSRCTPFEFERYSKDILKPYIDKLYLEEDRELALNICSTIGQVELYSKYDLNKLDKTVKTLIDKIEVVNFYNLISIVKQFEDSDIVMIFKLLIYNLHKQICYDGKINLSKYYNLTVDYMKRTLDKRIKGSSLLTNYLIEYWLLVGNNNGN